VKTYRRRRAFPGDCSFASAVSDVFLVLRASESVGG